MPGRAARRLRAASMVPGASDGVGTGSWRSEEGGGSATGAPQARLWGVPPSAGRRVLGARPGASHSAQERQWQRLAAAGGACGAACKHAGRERAPAPIAGRPRADWARSGPHGSCLRRPGAPCGCARPGSLRCARGASGGAGGGAQALSSLQCTLLNARDALRQARVLVGQQGAGSWCRCQRTQMQTVTC